MTDVAPGLLESVEGRFRELYEKNREIRDVIGRVEAGTATYADAQQYAELVSRDLTGACASVFTDGALPDGRMYWNIADRVLRPVIGEQTELIADVCERTQTALNQAAGIGMKAVRVQAEPDRVHGILDEAANAERFSDVADQVYSHMENLGRHVVDESVRQNADAQWKAGFVQTIHRTGASGCCQWCADRAGSYDYSVVRGKGDPVWQRHVNCGCLIESELKRDERKRVNNYRWDAERADIAERKARAEALTSDADPARIETRKLAAARAAAERDDRLGERFLLDAYHKHGDVMRTVTGSIKDSHPQEMERIIRSAESKGVEVVSRGGGIAYSPGIFPGDRGQLHVNENDSYAAWRHEELHMLDDEADGWPGFRGIEDTQRRSDMEYRAYSIEIKMALEYGRPDIAKLLIEDYQEEIINIGGVIRDFE